MFKKLLSKKSILFSEELKYFSYGFKKSTNLEKRIFLPKIYKRHDSVPDCLVILSCVTPSEKVSQFLDHQLKPLVQSAKLNLKILFSILKD